MFLHYTVLQYEKIQLQNAHLSTSSFMNFLQKCIRMYQK